MRAEGSPRTGPGCAEPLNTDLAFTSVKNVEGAEEAAALKVARARGDGRLPTSVQLSRRAGEQRCAKEAG